MTDALNVHFRQAQHNDIAEMAEIRAADWGDQEYWRERILGYLTHALHPQEALLPRVAFVCVEEKRLAGLIAGHLTKRFGCEGEVEWISVRQQYRGLGIASQLLGRLAEWFIVHGARYVCVDVEPSNAAARQFYARHGAQDLKPHWMLWKDIGAALKVQRGRHGE